MAEDANPPQPSACGGHNPGASALRDSSPLAPRAPEGEPNGIIKADEPSRAVPCLDLRPRSRVEHLRLREYAHKGAGARLRARGQSRASDVRGGAAPPRGSFTNFAPAPLACSRTTPPRVGAVSLLADPYGFVASAVSVLPSVAVAKAQLSALLAPSGRACIPRSLGETGSIEGPDTIGFKLSSAEIPVPHVLGGGPKPSAFACLRRTSVPKAKNSSKRSAKRNETKDLRRVRRSSTLRLCDLPRRPVGDSLSRVRRRGSFRCRRWTGCS